MERCPICDGDVNEHWDENISERYAKCKECGFEYAF